MFRPIPLLLAASALLATTSASAQTATQDVRCLLASNVFSSVEKDAQKKQIAIVSGIFFLGRASAGLNPAQLKAQLLAQGKAMNGSNLGPLMDTCARQVQQQQLALRQIGQEITKSLPPAKK